MEPLRVALYLRQSQSREDESLSLDGQERELRKQAEREGWSIVAVYRDADAPSWKYDKRDGWAQLLRDAKGGTFNAVAAYQDNRLWRDTVSQAVAFVMLKRDGVRYVVAGNQRYDLTNPKDAVIATVLAAFAQLSQVERILYTRIGKAEAARSGKPNAGQRHYGYVDSRFSAVDEHEASIIRELASRYLKGESASALARELNERGERTTQGAKWKHGTVTRLLRSPSIAGIRRHRPMVERPDASNPGDTVRGSEYVDYEASWPAIIDRETRAQLLRKLERKPREGRSDSALLVPLIRCARCGAKMYNHARKPGAPLPLAYAYACAPGSKTPDGKGCRRQISLVRVDDYVLTQVLALPDLRRALELAQARRDKAAGLDDLYSKLRQVDERAAALGAQLASGELDPELAHSISAGITAQRKEINARIDEAAQAATPDLLTGELDLSSRLKGRAVYDEGGEFLYLPGERDEHFAWRKSVLQALIQEIRIHPATRRGRQGFDARRVEIRWSDAAAARASELL